MNKANKKILPFMNFYKFDRNTETNKKDRSTLLTQFYCVRIHKHGIHQL